MLAVALISTHALLFLASSCGAVTVNATSRKGVHRGSLRVSLLQTGQRPPVPDTTSNPEETHEVQLAVLDKLGEEIEGMRKQLRFLGQTLAPGGRANGKEGTKSEASADDSTREATSELLAAGKRMTLLASPAHSEALTTDGEEEDHTVDRDTDADNTKDQASEGTQGLEEDESGEEEEEALEKAADMGKLEKVPQVEQEDEQDEGLRESSAEEPTTDDVIQEHLETPVKEDENKVGEGDQQQDTVSATVGAAEIRDENAEEQSEQPVTEESLRMLATQAVDS